MPKPHPVWSRLNALAFAAALAALFPLAWWLTADEGAETRLLTVILRHIDACPACAAAPSLVNAECPTLKALVRRHTFAGRPREAR